MVSYFVVLSVVGFVVSVLLVFSLVPARDRRTMWSVVTCVLKWSVASVHVILQLLCWCGNG